MQYPTRKAGEGATEKALLTLPCYADGMYRARTSPPVDAKILGGEN